LATSNNESDFSQRGYAPRETLNEFDLVDDYSQYARTLLEDCPRPAERATCRTKSVKDLAQEINFKAITTTVQDYEIKKNGFMKADFVMFQIVSEEPGKLYKMRTYRTDEDFYELRKLMVIAVPYVMVPPLPTKSIKAQDRKIPKRQRLY
jgi:hypothetical protein